MSTVLRDLRYGIRMLARTPAFTVVAILSLALGIGANATVFSLMDAVMLRSLPVHNPDQIVLVATGEPGEPVRVEPALRHHSLRSVNARECCRDSGAGRFVRELCACETGHQS